MKKNTFMQGAVVATSSIIVSKIIGVLYVILLYPMLGEKGGALYGYAYSIYSLFLGLSVAGIPFAISKITSQYDALGYHHAKEKSFKIGRIFICTLGIVGFILMFIFSKNIGYIFVGDIEGGNTIEDVAFVVRILASALLVVPILSVTRGYLQGHKYIFASSFSQVVEQFARVVFLLIGVYLSLNVFKIGLTNSIGVAVFGATFGAICAYVYLYIKLKKNNFNKEKQEIEEEEKKITAKLIIKNIIVFAIPFILIDLVRSGYTFVDLSNLNKTMVSFGYTLSDAESVTSIISTWGSKLESIVYSISVGLIVSLVPHISSSYAIGNNEDVSKKVNMSVQSLLFIVVPLVFLLSLLSLPIWNVFYSYNILAASIFQVFIIKTIFIALYNLSCSILNSISYSKIVVFSAIVGLIIKVALNIPLMNFMNYIKLHPAYGITVSSIIAFFVSSIINFIFIKKRIKVDYKDTFDKIGKIIFVTSIMTIILLFMRFIIPIDSTNRLISLLVSALYGIIGLVIYLFIMIKNKTIYKIFGDNIFDKIKNKLNKKRI